MRGIKIKKGWIDMFILYLMFFAVVSLMAQSAVVPHDTQYYKKNVRNTELIYTKKYQDIAQDVAKLEMVLQPEYEKTFGYKLDEKLYTAIISQNNQIANGFTDFMPNARQVDYIGGALMSDYFCSTSWIDTLIYHETAHSYQINAKDNIVSSSLHSVLKNGTIIIPWFINPNILENSFLLEGNAVLNESWHGNGGRLYGGNFKAETLLQAKYGRLTPQLLYNDNLHFLYGSHFYTLGSYYQYFLARKYGLDKTNSYFKIHSRDWVWPFFTNYTTKKTFGKDFETLVSEWNESLKDDAKNIKETKGKLITFSQYYIPLNSDEKEIFFVVNKTAREYPDRVVYDKSTKNFTINTNSYMLGKMVKTKDRKYVTQGSRKTNPWRIYAGLYDDEAILVDSTASKVVEGYLSNGDMVYFDINSSYHNPQLYVGDKFYASVNSSVFVHGSDIYYTKQSGKSKIFYKNKKKLFSIKSFYGHVVGADEKGIYFIANTKLGSGLFKYEDGRFFLLNESDTIIDARIVDAKSAVVVSVGVDAYNYMEVALTKKEQIPYEVKLFMEDEPYYKKASSKTASKVTDAPKTDIKEKYSSLLNMVYSGTNMMFGVDEDAGLIYNLSINFADPLMQNQFGAFIARNTDEFTLGGATYTNEQYFIDYTLLAYGIIDRPNKPTSVYSPNDKREYGVVANAKIDFLGYGYNYGYIRGSYFEDYVSNFRKPLSTSLVLGNTKHFGVSMYQNFLLQLKGYGVDERGDGIYGGEILFQQGLPYEFFISTNYKYSKSDANSGVDDRGVKLAKNLVGQFRESDPSAILMYSLKDVSFYTKEISKAGVKLTKVFNYDAYFFTFPISLRRESVYMAYNHYDLDTFYTSNINSNEVILGMKIDTTILNKVPIPMIFEYSYNDEISIANRDTFSVRLGYAF